MTTASELARALRDLQTALVLDEKTSIEEVIRVATQRIVAPDSGRPVSSPIFIPLSGGTFMMGSTPDEEGRYDDETLHEVTLTQGFEIQTTPVTQAQYQTIMATNPSRFKGNNHPVEQVSWFDAVTYANALSAREGLAPAYRIDDENATLTGEPGYRLPTEAEWEYACRAGSTGPRYGDLDEIAWYYGNSKNTTHPVSQKQPNAFGLYDMIGNVWEWCWDWYGPYSGSSADPLGPAQGSARVIRGGSWFIIAQYARAASRHYLVTPVFRYYRLGFRLARSLP